MSSMPIVVVISILNFNSQAECVRHLDFESSAPPNASKVYRRAVNKTMVELHGGHVVLKCEGTVYRAYLLEEEQKTIAEV